MSVWWSCVVECCMCVHGRGGGGGRGRGWGGGVCVCRGEVCVCVCVKADLQQGPSGTLAPWGTVPGAVQTQVRAGDRSDHTHLPLLPPRTHASCCWAHTHTIHHTHQHRSICTGMSEVIPERFSTANSCLRVILLNMDIKDIDTVCVCACTCV